MDRTDYHEGRPIIRNSPDNKTVVVLCPYGHLFTTLPMRDWAGSWLEAKAGDPNWHVKCCGTLPDRH